MKRKISVIEGKWYKKTHVSLRDLLGPMFQIWGKGESDFHYEMFSTKESFRTALDYAFGPHQADTIYVASHGQAKSIDAYHDGERVSRTEIVNSINEAQGTTSRGLFMGACLFTSVSNGTWLLEKCPRLLWIAGYSEEIDWVDSSALDLFFLRHLVSAARTASFGRRRRRSQWEAWQTRNPGWRESQPGVRVG